MKRKFTFNKIIRSKLYDILKEKEIHIVSKSLSVPEYKSALIMKLEEELEEIKTSKSKEELLEELCDVLEVIDALAQVEGASWNDLIKKKQAKNNEKGSFLVRELVKHIEISSNSSALEYYLARSHKYPEYQSS